MVTQLYAQTLKRFIENESHKLRISLEEFDFERFLAILNNYDRENLSNTKENLISDFRFSERLIEVTRLYIDGEQEFTLNYILNDNEVISGGDEDSFFTKCLDIFSDIHLMGKEGKLWDRLYKEVYEPVARTLDPNREIDPSGKNRKYYL